MKGMKGMKAPKKAGPKEIPKEKHEKGLEAADKVKKVELEELKKLMRIEIRELRKTLETEDKLFNLFNLEKEKKNNLWIIAKKELEDKEADLRNKDREVKDLEENHIMAQNLYKQKTKHLLFQNQDNHADMKIAFEENLKQKEDQNRIIMRDLAADNRDLKTKLKEQEISQLNYEFALKFETSKEKTLRKQEYERSTRELTQKYELKKKKLRQEMEELRNQKIKQLEAKKDEKTKEITDLHGTKYKNIKDYYNDITASNLSLINQFKADIQVESEKEEKKKKILKRIRDQNKNLKEPLEQLKIEIEQLKEKKKKWETIKKQKTELWSKIELLETNYRDLEYQYEVKLQFFNYLEREKLMLDNKFEETMYDIHQKSGLQNLILEKKLELVNERLEVKDCELNQVISVANIDESEKRRVLESLEEVISDKNGEIEELQEELRQIRSAHIHMVKAYDGKLSEFVIPVEELGFNPLVPSNAD